MNLKILVCSVVLGVIPIAGWGAIGVLDTCYDLAACKVAGSKAYCCHNGEAGTRTGDCPDGWTGTSYCTRETGEWETSDDKGYMAMTYGSCYPPDETYSCFVPYDSDTYYVGDGMYSTCVEDDVGVVGM